MSAGISSYGYGGDLVFSRRKKTPALVKSSIFNFAPNVQQTHIDRNRNSKKRQTYANELSQRDRKGMKGGVRVVRKPRESKDVMSDVLRSNQRLKSAKTRQTKLSKDIDKKVFHSFNPRHQTRPHTASSVPSYHHHSRRTSTKKKPKPPQSSSIEQPQEPSSCSTPERSLSSSWYYGGTDYGTPDVKITSDEMDLNDIQAYEIPVHHSMNMKTTFKENKTKTTTKLRSSPPPQQRQQQQQQSTYYKREMKSSEILSNRKHTFSSSSSSSSRPRTAPNIHKKRTSPIRQYRSGLSKKFSQLEDNIQELKTRNDIFTKERAERIHTNPHTFQFSVNGTELPKSRPGSASNRKPRTSSSDHQQQQQRHFNNIFMKDNVTLDEDSDDDDDDSNGEEYVKVNTSEFDNIYSFHYQGEKVHVQDNKQKYDPDKWDDTLGYIPSWARWQKSWILFEKNTKEAALLSSSCNNQYNNNLYCIKYDDVPWPDDINDLIPPEVAIFESEERKSWFRKLFLKWHPDKFKQMFGKHLLQTDYDRILEQVTTISQKLLALRDAFSDL